MQTCDCRVGGPPTAEIGSLPGSPEAPAGRYGERTSSGSAGTKKRRGLRREPAARVREVASEAPSSLLKKCFG